MNKIRWFFVVPYAMLAEVVPVLVLIGIVAVFGPRTQAEANVFAQSAGRFVGPIVGALAVLVFGWLAARGTTRPFANGVATGAVAAAIDLWIVTAAGAAFDPLFIVSALSRVVAGVVAGRLATRRVASA